MTHHGGCSNRECVCWNFPTRPCQKFVYYFTRHCIRCGWERQDHFRPALIHKGRKAMKRAGLIEPVNYSTSTSRSRKHGSLRTWTRTKEEA